MASENIPEDSDVRKSGWGIGVRQQDFYRSHKQNDLTAMKKKKIEDFLA